MSNKDGTITGWGLVAAGIAGCVLPVAPGIPLVLAGLVVLAKERQSGGADESKSGRGLRKVRLQAGAVSR